MNVIHYLDDFFIATPFAEEFRKLLQTVCEVFEVIGVPLASEKVVNHDFPGYQVGCSPTRNLPSTG